MGSWIDQELAGCVFSDEAAGLEVGCSAESGELSRTKSDYNSRTSISEGVAKTPVNIDENALLNRRGRDSNPRGSFPPSGFQDRRNKDVTCLSSNDYENCNECLGVLLSQLPYDLGKVINAWPFLSEPVRAGILAMIRAAGMGEFNVQIVEPGRAEELPVDRKATNHQEKR